MVHCKKAVCFVCPPLRHFESEFREMKRERKNGCAKTGGKMHGISEDPLFQHVLPPTGICMAILPSKSRHLLEAIQFLRL